MEDILKEIFRESIRVKEETLVACQGQILQAAQLIVQAIKDDKKILFFGNGGSAADSQHLAAEFIGRFEKERRSFPALSLTTDTSILTCLGNDYSFDVIFSRQIEGLGQQDDIAFGISTSGNSKNVIEGLKQARVKGLKTIGLTGHNGGQIKDLVDICIIVPSERTARIQESHLCIIHGICSMVENEF